MTAKLCIHAIVSGKVQGVYFRDTTQQKAKQLGLTGWVKNLPNGNVEVLACGEREPLMQLTEWLWEGPALATVKQVQWEEKPWQNIESFQITHHFI